MLLSKIVASVKIIIQITNPFPTPLTYLKAINSFNTDGLTRGMISIFVVIVLRPSVGGVINYFYSKLLKLKTNRASLLLVKSNDSTCSWTVSIRFHRF